MILGFEGRGCAGWKGTGFKVAQVSKLKAKAKAKAKTKIGTKDGAEAGGRMGQPRAPGFLDTIEVWDAPGRRAVTSNC